MGKALQLLVAGALAAVVGCRGPTPGGQALIVRGMYDIGVNAANQGVNARLNPYQVPNNGTFVQLVNLDNGSVEHLINMGGNYKPELHSYLISRFHTNNFPKEGFLIRRIERGIITATEKAILNKEGTRIIPGT